MRLLHRLPARLATSLAAFALTLPIGAAQAAESLNLHTVAIISALTDSIHLEETGWTIFDYQNDAVPLPGWGIDARIEKEIASQISAAQTTIASVDTKKLADCEDFKACAALLPKTSEIDAYVVVLKDETLGFSPRDRWSGIGLFHGQGFSDRFKAVLHVIYTIAVIDAKTGRIIRSEQGRLSETVFGGEHSKPTTSLNPNIWPGDGSKMTEEQKNTVKSAAIPLIEDSLRFTLKELGLR